MFFAQVGLQVNENDNFHKIQKKMQKYHVTVLFVIHVPAA